MKSLIVYPTALRFWMQAASIKNYDIIHNLNENKCGFSRDALMVAAQKFALDYPLHIAVPYGQQRVNSELFTFHVLTRGLPADSFVKIDEDVYIASPELCLVQAAASMPLYSAVETGNNLCGIYYYDRRSDYGQRKREPVITTDKIEKYIAHSGYINGLANARRAVKYIVPNSFSPYESKIAVSTVLPLSCGGFGYPRPSLNYDVKFSAQAARYMKTEMCCCDMVWPFIRVILEYDSTMTHLEVDQHYYDKKKITALNDSGYELISATAEQFKNFANYEALFELLRKKLKLRRRSDRMDKYIDKRYEVFRGLYRNF